MTAIYGILNKRMKLLSNILLVLICLAMTTELSGLRGVKRINVKENMAQHHRFSPYRANLRLLLREPPLKGQESLVHKDLVQELWMEQKVDHFDEANNNTWLMHYFRNDRYFQAAGPIFIFVGGEWEISPVYLLAGHMHDIAKQHNGMLYYVEHRFYGNSWPLGDAAVENLKFLNARQALADLAHFIHQLKAAEDMLVDSKVILTGASYSGSLVTWFAKLYPKLISAGWASSAPLVAKMDFYEYMQQVGKVIQHRGGHECARRLEAGLTAMAAILDSSNSSQLMRALRICNNFEATNQLDRAALFNGIGNYFAAYAQLYE
ncbi:putative serine protease K12H4.7 [Anastrepha ludens]|uniref:putative serine protease K12H4.7 n=1 Tax=Anastrepha ludens TaxID=28586 RepID=UPI0023B1C2EF|nr:putative serine protease K12H4.7 [Anastrepha ludens]